MSAKTTIVFIDDDKDDIFLFREILQDTHPDLSVTTFHDPEKAWEYLAATKEMPACIICDFNMPKIDGFKLRSLLLKAGGAIAQVPFFILSTAEVDWQPLLTRKLNIRGCYRKDPTVEGLTATIEKIFRSIDL